MFDVGGGELLLILIAILLLFGPSKLPELARSFGKGMAQIRRAQTEFQRNLNAISDEVEETVQDIQKEMKSVDEPIIHHTLEPIIESGLSKEIRDNAATEEQSERQNKQEGEQQTAPDDEVVQPTLSIRPPDGAVAR
jgi:Tat protein translocase TatB subunit